MTYAVLFILGLVATTFGADWLVTGASRLAGRLGISSLVIGLTVVAFGTSAPELFVSGLAAFRGQAGLAVGNIMGSTVANVGLIAGMGAIIRPIQVRRRLLIREAPLLVLVLIVVMLLSWNDALGRLDGLALWTGFLIYLVYLLRVEGRSELRVEGPQAAPQDTDGRAGDDEPTDAPSQSGRPDGEVAEGSSAGWDRYLWLTWLRTIVGLAALLGGANLLVDSAIVIARVFMVPEAVIGATMVAVGTSIPELASTVAAAARGLGDLAIGNVIGSNVFNLGLVLGSAALIRPLLLPPEVVVRMVLPALIFCVVLIPMAYTGNRVSRWEGAALLLLYGVFIYWVI